MHGRPLPRLARVVERLLLLRVAGDAVILDPDVHALARRGQIGADVVVVEVITHVAVEIAVGLIARIPFERTPHLLGRFHVPAKGGNPARIVQRRVDGIEGAGRGIHDGMGVDHEVLNAIVLEEHVYTWIVSAFGQPEPQRGTAKKAAVFLHANADLRARRLFVHLQEWQVPVGGRAGDEL